MKQLFAAKAISCEITLDGSETIYIPKLLFTALMIHPQCKQDQKFGQVSDNAQIQQSVLVISLRTETLPAGIITNVVRQMGIIIMEKIAKNYQKAPRQQAASRQKLLLNNSLPVQFINRKAQVLK